MMSPLSPDSSDIQHLCTIPTSYNKLVYSVCWDGTEVVAGCDDAILRVSPSYTSPSHIDALNIRGVIDCIRKVGDHAFAILHNKNDTAREVRISSINTLCDPKTTLCRINQGGTNLSMLAISEQYIEVCDSRNNGVNLWTTRGQFKMAIRRDVFNNPCGVLLLHDHLLVSDGKAGCLHKFRLDSHSAELIWTCKDLNLPAGACVDKHGFIYAACENGRVIYLISPQGKVHLSNHVILTQDKC